MSNLIQLHQSQKKVPARSVNVRALFDEYKRKVAAEGLTIVSGPYMDIQSEMFEEDKVEVTIRSSVKKARVRRAAV